MNAQLYSQARPWSAPLATGEVSASVALPGSKSLTNRELVLSALATGSSELVAPLESRDSSLMIEALQALGTSIQRDEAGGLRITPGELCGPATIDCGLAGTVMRFVPPLATLARGEVRFDGDEAARRRPMATTIESIRALGVEVSLGAQNFAGLPFTVSGVGGVRGGHLVIDASQSSQFVSGLLIAGVRFDAGLDLEHRGAALPSLPHIEMTLHCLAARGAVVETVDEARWKVQSGNLAGKRVVIEPDLSNAGPFLAAAMVAGGSVHIPHWPVQTTQVGREYLTILEAMGASHELDESGLTLRGSGEIRGIDIDLSIGGELAPTIAALCALAEGTSRIRGIAHLRGHETDRLQALSAEINALGGRVKELPDGLEIVPARLHGGLWHSYEDHRMATAGAIIGLRVAGIEIDDIGATSKTMPDFPLLWHRLLGIDA